MKPVLLFAHLVVGILMFLAFMVVAISTPTERNPAGEAGLYAPVLAIGAGTTLLLNRTRFGGSKGKLARDLMVFGGSLGSAALWLADEAETPVTNVKLWLDFGLVLVMVAGLALIAMVLLFIYRYRDSDPENL